MKKSKKDAVPAAFSEVIPTALDPRLYRKIESLCVAALQLGGNHPQIRQAIADLTIIMRKDAGDKIGHDTIDCSALATLLKKTDPNKPLQHQPPPPERDPIDVLELQGHLVPEQVSAAGVIRDVWQAFGRCLTVSGRGYDRSGGTLRRAQVLHPLDVMGEDIWEIYQELYVPWYNSIKDTNVPCKDCGNVRTTNVVFRVVVDEYFPSVVDKFLKLDDGRALEVLRTQLGRFFNDHVEEAFAIANARRVRTGGTPGMVDDTGKVQNAA